MSTASETRSTVESFFAAWTSGKEREARALLADDLEYSGPLNEYRSADALIAPLMKFAALLLEARLIHVLVEGERAALLYECRLPPPVGALRTATFQHVKAGKIRSYQQEFDATELRKLLARASGGS